MVVDRPTTEFSSETFPDSTAVMEDRNSFARSESLAVGSKSLNRSSGSFLPMSGKVGRPSGTVLPEKITLDNFNNEIAERVVIDCNSFHDCINIAPLIWCDFSTKGMG